MKNFSVLIVLLLSVFLFVAPQYANAKIWINEFSSDGSDDWIELYNDSDTAVSLEDLRIRDSSETNKLDLSGAIEGHGFSVFEWGSKLNKDGDTIKLLFKSNETNITDQVTYGSLAEVLAPESGQSAGRKSNGNSEWVLFSSVSKGSSNEDEQIVPTATSVPENTPTPTKVPTPTKTPTPKKEPTPTKSIKTTTDEDEEDLPVTKSNSLKPTPVKAFFISGVPTSILGISTNASDKKPTPKPVQPKQEVMVKGANNFPFLYSTVGGMLCLACGILIFLKLRKKKREI